MYVGTQSHIPQPETNRKLSWPGANRYNKIQRVLKVRLKETKEKNHRSIAEGQTNDAPSKSHDVAAATQHHIQQYK